MKLQIISMKLSRSDWNSGATIDPLAPESLSSQVDEQIQATASVLTQKTNWNRLKA